MIKSTQNKTPYTSKPNFKLYKLIKNTLKTNPKPKNKIKNNKNPLKIFINTEPFYKKI